MPKASTPSFISEVKLQVNQDQQRTLLVRLDCARQLYNAVLGEAMKRLAVVRASAPYKAAQALPRLINEKPNPARKALFQEARKLAAFSEYDLHAYATPLKHSWLGDHLDINTVQKVATRAFKAVNDYAFGKHGKPRFKGKGQFGSVEGKTNASGIIWRNGAVRWLGLELKASIDEKDTVLMHGLQSPLKYVRIVRRKFGEQFRWFAQLVCEGLPYLKHKIASGVVGLDIGPSTIAIVSEQTAELKTFCDKLQKRQQYIRRLQRKIDRSRRATNPQHYNANGTTQKGAGRWHNSKRYNKTAAAFSESSRKQAAHRKTLHNQMVNQILALGNTVKLEKLSYKAFQKMFGRSVAFRAPGMFVQQLRRKAANAGGATVEFEPRSTRLSQTCVCGALEKKLLRQRWHDCQCGVLIQRDIFSAWLATHVENGKLNAGQVLADWPNAENRLRTALGVTQLASNKVRPVQGSSPQSELSAFSNLSASESHWFEQLSLFLLNELASS